MQVGKKNFKQKNNCNLLSIILLFFGLIYVHAQVQNNGNLYVNDNGSFFVKTGAFAFGTNSVTTTSRTVGTFGKLIFGGFATSNGAASGASLFIDGIASTRSTFYFVLPTGQTSTYAPIGISNAEVTNGVDASYYVGSLANTLNLSSSIAALPPSGYWDVKGDNATLTMIWNSDRSNLSNSIANLTVAGYNITTNKWESIISNSPTGTLINGTITTSAAVILSNYNAFTLAKKGILCADLIAYSGITRTWDGTSWDIVPTLADAVVIMGTFPSTGGSFVCNSLVVNANITLIDNQTIEVVNGITGSGTITMSSASSILQRNDTSVITPTIALSKSTRIGMYAYDYIYWGSPLKTNTFDQLATARAYNNANTTATGATGAFDLMYKYVSGDTTVNGGWQALTTTTPGSGFIMRMKLQTPFTSTLIQNITDHINLTFTGLANNGVITVPITNTDLTISPNSARNNNLLANPYPSAIDSDKFLEYNTNLDGVVYIWKALTPNSGVNAYNNSDYIAYTRAGSTAASGIGAAIFNGKIATGQGFKVKAMNVSGTGTAVFNNCMRVSGNNNQFMRANSDVTVDRYKLNIIGNNGVGNQILIAYMPETTLGYDRMYDAELNSVSPVQLYSSLAEGNKQLAINARPSFENTDIVNLGVIKSNVSSENFSIAISEKEGVFSTSPVNVFLHDNLLNIYHNLADGAYTFNTSAVALNNRFQVLYQDSTLNNSDFESNNVFAKISNEIIKIASSLPMTDLSVYDLSGRLVMNIKVNNQNEITNEFLFAEGIYIAKIKMNNGAVATIKLINY